MEEGAECGPKEEITQTNRYLLHYCTVTNSNINIDVPNYMHCDQNSYYTINADVTSVCSETIPESFLLFTVWSPISTILIIGQLNIYVG